MITISNILKEIKYNITITLSRQERRFVFRFVFYLKGNIKFIKRMSGGGGGWYFILKAYGETKV